MRSRCHVLGQLWRWWCRCWGPEQSGCWAPPAGTLRPCRETERQQELASWQGRELPMKTNKAHHLCEVHNSVCETSNDTYTFIHFELCAVLKHHKTKRHIQSYKGAILFLFSAWCKHTALKRSGPVGLGLFTSIFWSIKPMFISTTFLFSHSQAATLKTKCWQCRSSKYSDFFSFF